MHEDEPNEKGKCVLLADSHPETLDGIRGLLEAVFDTFVMLADKRSLFEMVGRVQPDLVVVDLSLEPASEEDIAREIKRRHPDLKFIVLSSHPDPSVAESIIESGASGLVFKPCMGVELLAAVKSIRQGQMYVSPRIRGSSNAPL
ncbi:MAG: response regulator [Planctomycetota bacterium]|jgi:DNA-binding NarL/FixJ family response regulator